jgi:hypothetical protein
MDDNEDETVDISWMNDHVEHLEGKTAINEINVKIMYISCDNSLIHTETENCILEYENEYSIFPRDKFLLLIQTKKKRGNKKYRLSELLLYNVELEPENLQNYSKTKQSNTYLKILSIMDDIRIPPSIVIFHTINTLYFIFQEIIELPNTKPILKIQGTTTGCIRRKTKKVEFNDIGRFTRKKKDEL